MPKITYQDLDSVPEDLRDAVSEVKADDGSSSYVFEAFTKADVDSLKLVADKERKAAAEAAKKLKAFGDISAEELATIRDEHLRLKEEAERNALKAEADKVGLSDEKLADLQEKWESESARKIKKVDESYQTKLADQAKEIDRLNSVIREQIETTRLSEALANVKVRPEQIRNATRLLLLDGLVKLNQSTGTIEVIDAEGDPRPIKLEDYLKTEWFEQNKVFFESQSISGTGTPNSGGGNSGKHIDSRTKMSPKDRRDYIQRHGKDEYLKLPI